MARVTDPGWDDPLEGSIYWGDGYGTLHDYFFGPVDNERPNATLPFTEFHRYGDNGSYVVEICGEDDDTTTCETITVDIDNVAPSVDAGADKVIDEGDLVTSEATFTDPGWLDTYNATVDWDDPGLGSDPATITITSAGSSGTPDTGTATAAKVYGDNGVFAVETTVYDDDGGVGTDSIGRQVRREDTLAD
jgi:hypothetical protein